MAKAVRGDAAPSKPAAAALLESPTEEPSSGDEMAKAVRGEAAPSRPAVPAPPDFAHLEVDRQSLPNIVQSSDEEPEIPEGGEASPSKAAESLPASLQRLLHSYQPVGDAYTPYTAVLGAQRRNPKLIWHHFVAVRQELPRMQQRGQLFERKVYQLIGNGTNRAAFCQRGWERSPQNRHGWVPWLGSPINGPRIATCRSDFRCWENSDEGWRLQRNNGPCGSAKTGVIARCDKAQWPSA